MTPRTDFTGIWDVAKTSLVKVGFWRTLRAVPGYVFKRRRLEQRFFAARMRMEHEDGFDARHGTRTTELVSQGRLNADAIGSAKSAVLYWPVLPRTFTKIMAKVPVNYPEYVFIDLGCGMGRALLMASEFPFQQIIGVEFSPSLVGIAVTNARGYDSPTQRCDRIEVRLQDATAFEFPSSPLFVFMFDPFRPPVLTKVLENLRQSLQQTPRPLVLAYLLPHENEAHLLAWLTRAHDEPGGLPDQGREYPWTIFTA